MQNNNITSIQNGKAKNDEKLSISASPFKNTFFIVPTHILELEGLTLGYLKVFESMFQFWHHNRACFLSTQSLSKRTGLKPRQVFYALEWLESKNIIKRVISKGKRHFEPVYNHVEIEDGSNVIQECTAVHDTVHSSALSLCTPVHHNIKNLNKENNINTIADSSNTASETKVLSKTKKNYKDDERFMRFYSIYPKKVQPRDAYKAFCALKPDDAMLDAIIEDVNQRKLHVQSWSDLQFIPYPATYLRSGEFESEIVKSEEERERKRIQNDLERKKRDAEQDRMNRKTIEYEQNKHARHNQDAIAFRKIKEAVDSGTGRPKGLNELMQSMGMNKP